MIIVDGLPFNLSLWTYVSNRDLRVLYFDGLSAKLGSEGVLDVQEVLLQRRGGILEREWWADYQRLRALCKWAKGKGIDGFIRQNIVSPLCSKKHCMEWLTGLFRGLSSCGVISAPAWTSCLKST
jgi:hypothetical protein